MPVHLGRPQRRGVRPGRPCTQATLARGLPTAKHPDFVKVCACHSRQATRPSEAHADRLPWQGACLATRHLGRTQISPTCRHFASSFCCCTFCRVQAASVSDNILTWLVLFSCPLLQASNCRLLMVVSCQCTVSE